MSSKLNSLKNFREVSSAAETIIRTISGCFEFLKLFAACIDASMWIDFDARIINFPMSTLLNLLE